MTGGFEEADFQHHLLRRCNRHGIDHGCIGRHGFCQRDGAFGGYRVARHSAQHNLAVFAGHPNSAFFAAQINFSAQITDIGLDDDIEDADQVAVGGEHRHVRGANFLAQEIQRAIGYRHRIDDVGGADDRLLESPLDVKRVRLVDGERNLDHSFAVADPTAVALSGGSVIVHEHRKGENCRDRREVCGHASGCATPNAAQRRTGAQRNPTP
ncbi:MAG: hypothetical protein WB677_09550 [Xanthobacteraceae bacterium]